MKWLSYIHDLMCGLSDENNELAGSVEESDHGNESMVEVRARMW